MGGDKLCEGNFTELVGKWFFGALLKMRKFSQKLWEASQLDQIKLIHSLNSFISNEYQTEFMYSTRAPTEKEFHTFI